MCKFQFLRATCREQYDNMVYYLGLKKLFVSCNPTLTSFYSKNPYPEVFSALPTPNQRKTCTKHTFLTKKIMHFFFTFFLPTYPISFQTVTGNKHYFFLALLLFISINNELITPTYRHAFKLLVAATKSHKIGSYMYMKTLLY